ncbi:MAG TPA: hypothetical protein VMC06_06005, partial [Opitutaceae bacterium]|nr:hypothetical protein [Opitutaceae bacterium]
MHRPPLPAAAPGQPIQFVTYYVSNFVWARRGATTSLVTFYVGKVFRVAVLALAFVTYYVTNLPAAYGAEPW